MTRSAHFVAGVPRSTVIVAIAFCVIGGAGGGCAVRENTPRTRVGALPFPGPFTLYTTADPARLGVHQYGRLPRFFQADEKERGIVYTDRAGFLDVAHMRESIDWTRYHTQQLRAAVRAGKSRLTLAQKDRSRLHLTFNYPPGWGDVPRDEKDALADEIAARGGQQLTLLRMTWHETITWFGYRRVPLIDESWSAFSYDDTMSHVIGARVAARAMRDVGVAADADTFDRAATAAFAAELRELGAVGPRETTEAARAVEGQWWADGRPLRRHMDEGEWDRERPVVHPWLVPASAAEPPEPFELPTLRDVRGRDLSNFMSVVIEPRYADANAVLRHLPDSPSRVSAETDLPKLLAVVRSKLRERFGPQVIDPPWAQPSAGATAQAGPIERGASGGRATHAAASSTGRDDATR